MNAQITVPLSYFVDDAWISGLLAGLLISFIVCFFIRINNKEEKP